MKAFKTYMIPGPEQSSCWPLYNNTKNLDLEYQNEKKSEPSNMYLSNIINKQWRRWARHHPVRVVPVYKNFLPRNTRVSVVWAHNKPCGTPRTSFVTDDQGTTFVSVGTKETWSRNLAGVHFNRSPIFSVLDWRTLTIEKSLDYWKARQTYATSL